MFEAGRRYARPAADGNGEPSVRLPHGVAGAGAAAFGDPRHDDHGWHVGLRFSNESLAQAVRGEDEGTEAYTPQRTLRINELTFK